MIHPRELEVLNILYGKDEEMTSMDIVEARKGLSQSTVQAVLRKMNKEGLVEVVGVTHSNNVLSRTYRPTELSKKLVIEQYVKLYGEISNIASKDEIINALIGEW